MRGTGGGERCAAERTGECLCLAPDTCVRAGAQTAQSDVDFSLLLGTWANLHPGSHHLLEVELRRHDGDYLLRALAYGETGPVDWGETPAQVYVAGGTRQPLGWRAHFRLDKGDAYLAANINQGVCVIQAYISFAADSGRTNYFSKEYFRVRDGAAL